MVRWSFGCRRPRFVGAVRLRHERALDGYVPQATALFNPTEEASMRPGRILCAVSIAAVLAALMVGTLPGSAATRSQLKPSWWGKLVELSSNGVHATSPIANSSVGSNVDVSNLSGPQSETSIAIDP